MSNEQYLEHFTNQSLSPEQIPSQLIPTLWPEPFGILPKLPTGDLSSSTLPLFKTNFDLPPSNPIDQNTDFFGTFNNFSLNNLSASTNDQSWAFYSPSTENSLPRSITSLAPQALELAQQKIDSFFQKSDWVEEFSLAFGQGFDPAKAKSYSQQQPTIEVVPDNVLGTAQGAFAIANNTIFLSQSLVERGEPQEIATVIIEEIGHRIDAYINQQDSPGDEGAIFANLVNDIQLSQSEYVALVNKNDHSQILWEGQSLEVENSTVTNFAIKAEGLVNFNGSSDLDGDPLNLSDDALVYAGKGFIFNGSAVLPV